MPGFKFYGSSIPGAPGSGPGMNVLGNNSEREIYLTGVRPGGGLFK
jgi:hypothetical protein